MSASRSDRDKCLTRTLPQNYRLVWSPSACLLKSSPIPFFNTSDLKTSSNASREFIVVTPAGSRTFQGPLVMASLTAFPGNGGELHHKPAHSVAPARQTTHFHLTLLIDIPDTLLTSPRSFCLSRRIPSHWSIVHIYSRRSLLYSAEYETKRYQHPGQWKQSHDQLFAEDKPNPTKSPRNRSNIREYSTKLDNFKLF